MIFVDTSAFYAVLSQQDSNNPRATGFWQKIMNEDIPLLCNNYVVSETLALLQNRIGIVASQDFHETIMPFLEIEWMTEEKHNFAMNLFLAANRRHLSLVDVSAFATMRRRGVNQVFTFGNHLPRRALIAYRKTPVILSLYAVFLISA